MKRCSNISANSPSKQQGGRHIIVIRAMGSVDRVITLGGVGGGLGNRRPGSYIHAVFYQTSTNIFYNRSLQRPPPLRKKVHGSEPHPRLKDPLKNWRKIAICLNQFPCRTPQLQLLFFCVGMKGDFFFFVPVLLCVIFFADLFGLCVEIS